MGFQESGLSFPNALMLRSNPLALGANALALRAKALAPGPNAPVPNPHIAAPIASNPIANKTIACPKPARARVAGRVVRERMGFRYSYDVRASPSVACRATNAPARRICAGDPKLSL